MVSQERHSKRQQRIDKTDQLRQAAEEANFNSIVSIVLKVMESLEVRITKNLMMPQKKFEGRRICTIILGKSSELRVIKA